MDVDENLNTEQQPNIDNTNADNILFHSQQNDQINSQNLTMSSVSNLPHVKASTTDDLNRRLLNAKLPEAAYDLVKDVPKEFLQASFDPVAFVDEKLKSSAFSPQLLDNLIKDADQMLENLDGQIIESLEVEAPPVPPSFDSAQELLKNLVTLGKKADESRQKAVNFANQLQKLQNARKQLDTLALQIALCKAFKDEAKSLEAIDDITDIKQQYKLIKSAYLLHLAEKELNGLRDTPQLQDSFQQFDKFKEQIDKLSANCKHTDDSFNFWSQQAIILGYKAATGKLTEYQSQLCNELMTEAFPELFDSNIQQFSYLKRVSAFLQAHKHYMKDLEAPIAEALKEAMHRYIDLQQRYGQIGEEQTTLQTGEFYKHFCDTLLKNIINQAKQFAQVVIGSQNTEALTYQSQYQNNGQSKLLVLQQQLEQLEQQLAQDPDSGIRAGAIAGWCPESTDMILSQLQSQLRNITSQQIKSCYKNVTDTNNVMLQILNIFEQFPHEGTADQGQTLLQQLNSDIQEKLPILLKNLDFSQYVTQRVEKQINGIRAGQNGSFYNLFKGIQQPLVKLQSFNCGTLMFVDPLIGDARGICMQVLHNLKQLDELFSSALRILQGRVYRRAEELRDPYAFGETQQEAHAMSIQSLIQALAGVFHVGVFCGGSHGRPQAIVAAKDALLVSLREIEESGLLGQPGDFETMQFRLQLSDTIIEQIGTIFVGQLLKDSFSASDIQLLLTTVGALHEELDSDRIAGDGGLPRLKLALNAKLLAAEGAVPSRTEFQALSAGVEGAQQWYDEMCLGVLQK